MKPTYKLHPNNYHRLLLSYTLKFLIMADMLLVLFYGTSRTNQTRVVYSTVRLGRTGRESWRLFF